MQLYTRLINEGIFIFWNDENVHDYNLKISIFNGDKKIKILDTIVSKDQCFYTLKNIGSGEYEIELNSFKDDMLIQTEVKKVKLVSSSEGIVNLLDKLAEIDDKIFSMSLTLTEVKLALEDPRNIVNFDGYRRFIQRIKDEMR